MITIPTYQQLYASILQRLESEFDAVINPVGKAELRAQAAVQAGTLKDQYLAIAQTQKNIFVDTCDEETLIRFGLIKINRQPFAAVAGQYDVTITGSNGAIIPAQSIFKSDDSSLNPGILYILDNAFTMTGTTNTITVRSLTLGIESKMQIGDTMTATAPIPLVNSIVTVSAETIQPLAAETIEAYRSIVINAFRLEAQGGAATDYRIWSADAQGVKTVYPYARSGYPSEINLFIEANISDSIDGKGTPSQGIIDEVEEVVNFDPDTSLPQNERGRRPLQVIVNYEPITPITIVITINSFQGLTPSIQAQLLTAFETSIDLIRPFVAAADSIADKNDILDTNRLSNIIYTAIPGSVYGPVTFTVAGASTGGTYTFTNGFIPYLDPTIIYI
jgi:hypothetical protein